MLDLPDTAIGAADAAGLAVGILLRAYNFDKYKTKKDDADGKPADQKPSKFTIQCANPAAAKKAFADVLLGADRLARLRRGDERRRAHAARRPGRRLRGDGLRDARPLPPRRSRRSRARSRAGGGRGRASAAIELAGRRRPTPRAGARRLLPGRRRPRARSSARRGMRRRARRQLAQRRLARVPAAALRRRDRGDHRGRDRAARASAAPARPARRGGPAVGVVWALLAICAQPARGRARPLGGDAARAAAHPAAARLRAGHPAGAPHAGRGADAAHRRRRDRRAARGARGPLPRQPRSATSRSRCSPTSATPPSETIAGDDGAARSAPRDGDRGAQRASTRAAERRGRFFLFHRAAPLEPARGRVDGLGAQARQARGASTRALRGERDRLRHRRRRRSSGCRACSTSSRSTATRSCRATRRAQLVGTLAHPLNRPRYDAARGRVTDGLRDPAAARRHHACRARARSRFARLFAGEPGIDPYTRAVSDVYQDLFGEGSFIGKGIYDVDAFQQALGGRLPENRILSHDLLEGALRARRAGQRRACCSRTIPSALRGRRQPARTAGSAATGRSRAWLLPARARRATAAASRTRSRCCRSWKILDNLRRSLVPVALLALLVVGWVLPGARRCSRRWRSLGDRCCCPALLAAAAAARAPAGRACRAGQHAREIAATLARQLVREAFALACLPYDACAQRSTRSCAPRCACSSRGASCSSGARPRDAQRSARTSLAGAVRVDVDRAGRRGGVAVGARCSRDAPALLRLAAPVLALWLLAPALAWWLSRPLAPAPPRLARRRRALPARASRGGPGASSRRSSAPSDNHLPPDNFQEDPPRGVAHRTSPTNIGLCAAREPRGVRLRLHHRRRGDRAHDAHARARWTGCSATAVTSTTGTTRARSSRCGRCTSRRSTAATSPATCSRSRPGSTSCAGHADRAPEIFAGPRRHARRARRARARPAPTPRRASRAQLRDTPPRTLSGCARAARAADRAAARARARASSARRRRELDWWARRVRGAVPQRARRARRTWRRGSSCRPRSSDAGARELRARSTRSPTLAETGAARRRCARDRRALGAAAAPAPAARALARAARRRAPRPSAPARASPSCGSSRRAAASSPTSTTSSSTTATATCSRSATTSATTASTPASTTCSPPRRGSPASSRSRRASCRRSTGSASAGCSPPSGGRPALLSWSGSMFEYLMPLLVMPTYDGTLLDETYRARRRPADRVRPRARRAVGRLRVRLQQDRRAAQLPVPRVRRARASASSAASPTTSSSRRTPARWR